MSVREVVDLQMPRLIAPPAFELLTHDGFPSSGLPSRRGEVNAVRVLPRLCGRSEVTGAIAVEGGIRPDAQLVSLFSHQERVCGPQLELPTPDARTLVPSPSSLSLAGTCHLSEPSRQRLAG